jgi:N-acetylglucosaminyl-diphospho-decaprenol L-rhamnosyltransferase
VTPCVAVVTILRGRHDHLLRQLWGLRRQTVAPDLHVVVAMDDPAVEALLAEDDVPWATEVVHVPCPGGRLPLAAARNAGVAAAAARGVEVVVLLDVDCIPSPQVVERYTSVLHGRRARGAERPVVACGEVRYLDAATTAVPLESLTWARLEQGGRPHPARRMPSGVREVSDLRLFWSLSFATTPQAWVAVGGFDEGYLGYGGEDTDFGQRLGAADGTMLWLGGAVAFHQHHESQTPPVRHAGDVVENANRFARTWGWWPMQGWLDHFEDIGLVRRAADGTYHLTSPHRPIGHHRYTATPDTTGPSIDR